MLGNNYKTGFHLPDTRLNGPKALQRVRQLNMPGPQVNEPNRKLPRVHREQTEIAIVADHDAPFGHGRREYDGVRLTTNALLHCSDGVLALPTQLRRHRWMNVLVSQ